MAKWNPNKYEQALMSVIEEAKRYCKGELELNHFENGWYAMDYREALGGAVEITAREYAVRSIITDETARKYKVDVRRCCDECGVTYVG